MSGSPEELLRSALEKIVFFECRVASLESELSAARSAAARAREQAGGGRQRESELEQAYARLRAENAVLTGQGSELGERVRLLEAERERFLSGMVERARVAGAPVEDDGEPGDAHALAGFIAELRAEIEELRGWKRAAEAAGVRPGSALAAGGPPPGERVNALAAGAEVPARPPAAEVPTAVAELATRFEDAGRLGVSREEARRLPAFTTRTERALYEASLDDLAASDPGVRRRAADGLRALGSRSAAPLVAAAIGREPDTEVKVALLGALGALAEVGAADLALRELDDPRPAVRAAALEAASALGREGVAPQLARALGDPSPLVRRRAAVLLGFTRGEVAEESLAAALSDRDAGVARAAAVALAGRPSPRAQKALVHALDHPEASVRRAAARAVERWSGEAVDAAASEPDRRRTARRIADELFSLGGEELRRAVTRVPADAAPRGAPPAVEVPARTGRRVGSGVPTTPPAGVKGDDQAADPGVAAAALAEVQTALRGRTAAEIAAALAREPALVARSLDALVSQGALIARGPRYFMG